MEELQLEWLKTIDIYPRMTKLIGAYDKDKDYVGPEDWRGKLVPRYIFGIDVNVCAYIHDYRYEIGGTEFNRLQADSVFFSNMMKWVDKKKYPFGTNFFMKRLAKTMVFHYYNMVMKFGKSSFIYN